MNRLGVATAVYCFLLANGGVLKVIRPISTLLKDAGVPSEEHEVTTADGFILGMTRIPAASSTAPVVLLQHGLLDSGATWLLNLPHQSLGFILARAGFDVWMGNSRGNTYGNRHATLTHKDLAYWNAIDFSAMAQYDLPAMVDRALTRSGRETLMYVGHSQGTTQMFAALAQNYSGLRRKISLFVALSPVAYVRHIKSLVMKALADMGMDRMLRLIGQRGFVPNEDFYSKLGMACNFVSEACKLVPLVICGADMTNMNTSRFSLYLEYTAAGTSTHNMCHWAQHVRSGRFGMFDWGPLGNLRRYLDLEPPQYNLSDIDTPIALFAGGADTLSEKRDVDVLSARLQRVVFTDIQTPYGHLDFVWGLDANQRIYPHVLRLLQQYSE